MSDDHLDRLIERLNDGDFDAAERVFLAYEPYLRMAIRRQLSGPLRSKLDSMDIVQSVWADVLPKFRDAGWRFADRAHLRAFLDRWPATGSIDRRRQHRHALERERPLDETAPAELPGSAQPRPSEVAEGRELWERMLEQCPPAHRQLLLRQAPGAPPGRDRRPLRPARGERPAHPLRPGRRWPSTPGPGLVGRRRR